MGLAKRMMEEIDSRGYESIPNKYVCQECVDEEGVNKFVGEHLSSKRCTYCGKTNSTPIAAKVEDVTAHILESISSEWMMPEDSGTPYETREGGWLVDPIDLEDVLEEEEFYSDEAIYSDIVGAIQQEYWSKEFANPYPEKEILYYWESFCSEVKHNSRYVFFRMLEKDSYAYDSSEDTSSCGILDAVAEYCAGLGMVKSIPAGLKIYRARVHDSDMYSTVKELGPPPKEKAKYSNRMSPAGIPMFYGAGDKQTAIIEAASGDNRNGIASVGTFETLKDINILDLSSLPSLPSIFDSNNRQGRIAVRFMRDFLIDFQKAIIKDGREHIEYVPTQIVTEFFRHIYKPGEKALSGIKYKSAQKKSGFSYVLFANQDNCVEDKKEDPLTLMDGFLSLDTANIETAPVSKEQGSAGGLVIGALAAGAVAYGIHKFLEKE